MPGRGSRISRKKATKGKAAKSVPIEPTTIDNESKQRNGRGSKASKRAGEQEPVEGANGQRKKTRVNLKEDGREIQMVVEAEQFDDEHSTDGEITSDEEHEISFLGVNNNATREKSLSQSSQDTENVGERGRESRDEVLIHAPTNDPFSAESSRPSQPNHEEQPSSME